MLQVVHLISRLYPGRLRLGLVQRYHELHKVVGCVDDSISAKLWL